MKEGNRDEENNIYEKHIEKILNDTFVNLSMNRV